LAGAGLLTFVIGFALKDIGENFLSGIILAFKSPFRIDDLIEVNQILGFVKASKHSFSLFTHFPVIHLLQKLN